MLQWSKQSFLVLITAEFKAVILCYKVFPVEAQLSCLIYSGMDLLRQGPDWKLAFHGQTGQLLKPLCPLLH